MMIAYRKIIPLVFLVIFFSQHVCFANSFLSLNQDSVAQPTNYLSLNEYYQKKSLLADNTNYQSEQPASSGGGLDAEKLHKYLGYASVLLAGMTAVSGSHKEAHYAAAYSTIAASVATLTTGYMAYGDRFSFEDGIFTEDNNHIILGTIGALGCIAAVALADSSGGNSHDNIGVVAGGAMVLSVITIKW
jgi:hypothetical protein